MTTATRKPRIALMGEFSAGKSTLSNLLLGARPLPEKVTATRLSPVWMAAGDGDPYRVDVDGREEMISLDALDGIPVDETRVIRLFFEADILDMCDLIDFPGISDPNMSSDVWRRMLDEVDAIIWCTHATQAWRQSEAAVWETIPQEMRDRSMLLVTRFDKLTTERDCQRVLGRLAKETEGLFAATFPISLTDALAAGDDYDAFEASGGIDFLEYFLKLIERLHGEVCETEDTLFKTFADDALSAPSTVAAPSAEVEETTQGTQAEPKSTPLVAVETTPAPEEEAAMAEDAVADDAGADRVVPRRVRPQAGGARRSRPSGRPEAIDMTAATAAATGAAATSAPAGPVSELRSIFQEAPEPAED